MDKSSENVGQSAAPTVAPLMVSIESAGELADAETLLPERAP
jgi:hypothetical protein